MLNGGKKACEDQNKSRNASAKKNAVAFGAVILIFLVALFITFYVLLQYYYNRMNKYPADTDNSDLGELIEIFRRDLDADVSGYPEKDIHSARSAAVSEKISSLPHIDYRPIADALKNDINADISAYIGELTDEEMSIVRWAVYYGFENILKEISPDETTEGRVTSDTDKATSPVTSVPPPSISTAITGTEPSPIAGVTVTDNDIRNILIIGVNSDGECFEGRSDTVIIASINKASKRVILSFIMKDTVLKSPESSQYVKVSSFFTQKASVDANAASLRSAIEYNFGIKVHNYIALNESSFKEITDIFGGVDVPLYYSEYIDLNDHFKDDVKNSVAGLDGYYNNGKDGYVTVTLNPSQAFRYAVMSEDMYSSGAVTDMRADDCFKAERQTFIVKSMMQRIRGLSFDSFVSVCSRILLTAKTDINTVGLFERLSAYSDYHSYSVWSENLSQTEGAWFYCKTNGREIAFLGDAGYECECADCKKALKESGTRVHPDIEGETGIGIFEAPYKNGYAIINEAWHLSVYK